VQPDEDSQLFLQVARGDRAAFARLFDRHQARVVRFCARFVGDAGRAEDLAQEIFVKLYRSAGQYQPSARFKTFLFRVATNHCLNELRRPVHRVERVEAQVSQSDDEPAPRDGVSTETPDQALEAREVETAVQRALAKMSERERAAFTMCRFEGMAYRDIAFALEASEAAVKSLIHRATLQVVAQLDALKAALTPAQGVVAHA
jgi:RNA polymerase sigma-70 factor (ECF subfamily)